MGHRRGDQVLGAGGAQEAADAVDVGHVEVGEGLVDEDETAGAGVVHEQPDQQHQRLHHLLPAGGLAVVEANGALAVEVEAHLEAGVVQRNVVVLEVRRGAIDVHAGQLAERLEVAAILAHRGPQLGDVGGAGLGGEAAGGVAVTVALGVVALALGHVGGDPVAQGEHRGIGDPLALVDAAAQPFEFTPRTVRATVALVELGEFLRVLPAGRHAAPAAAQLLDALGLAVATGRVVTLDLGKALLAAPEVALAPLDLDIDTVDLAGHLVQRRLGVDAAGDGGGEPALCVGQRHFRVGVLGCLGGQQLPGLEAHELLTQGGQPRLGLVELRIQPLAPGVEPCHFGLECLDPCLAGELAEMKVAGAPEVARAAVLAVVAVAGNPFDVAWQVPRRLDALHTADAVEQGREPARHRRREAHYLGETHRVRRRRLFTLRHDEVAETLALAERPGRMAVVFVRQQHDVPVWPQHRFDRRLPGRVGDLDDLGQPLVGDALGVELLAEGADNRVGRRAAAATRVA